MLAAGPFLRRQRRSLRRCSDRLYRPLRTTDGTCLCSDLSQSRTAAPGRPLDLYAVMPAPPAGVTRLAVMVPMTPPFTDVAIGFGSGRSEPDETIDPGKTALAAPVTRPLISEVDGDTEDVTQDDNNRTVRLSADVLFRLNTRVLAQRRWTT
jgi:hypothetical protein